jgi:predicted ABC-type ATPase
MPKIYIVAGTPGIGKSTSGKYFVPSTVKILNHDSLLLYFKNKSAIRATLREKYGGHSVKVSIIEQMYKNMIPLLQKNASLIHNIQLINVEFDSLRIVYPINNNLPSTYLELVNWVSVLSPETLKLESSINNRM